MTPTSHHRPFAAFLLTLVLAAPVPAQSGVADAEQQLAAARELLTTATPAHRAELIVRCDEAYRRLIAAAPADDRVPSWWADRAACSLDLAALDGADLSVLFGTPTAAQFTQVRTRALEAHDLLQRAEQSASQVVARMEAQLVDRSTGQDAKARAAQTESRLRQLVDVEQLQRLPYLKSITRIYIAATTPDRASKELAQAAAKDLKGLVSSTPHLTDARRVALGAALLHAQSLAPERHVSVLAAAADQFEPVAAQYTQGADPSTQGVALRARLGLIRCGRDLTPRPRLQDEAAEREIDLLETEARAASSLDRAAREPAQRLEFQGDAVRTLLTQLSPGRPDLIARVYEKIAQAIPVNAPLEKLPPEATFAKAVARVRSSGTADQTARDDAIAFFQRVINRTDAPASLQSDARWEKAVLIAAAGNSLAEVDAAAGVFRADPEYPQSPVAARRVVALFASAQSPSGTLPDSWRAKDSALREALELLVRKDIASSDQWRQELIRYHVADIGRAQSLDAVERAFAFFDRISDAQTRTLAAGAISDALWRTMEVRRAAAADVSDRLGPASARPQWSALLPWASRALAWARKSDTEREPAYALLVGESLVGVGDAQAASILAELGGGSIDLQASNLWGRYRLALGRAYRLAGEDLKAAATLRELADRLEGEPGATTRDPAFWAAWAELLSIMQAQNASGTRSNDIRLQIKRLELLDAKLGEGPNAQRIAQIRAQVGE